MKLTKLEKQILYEVFKSSNGLFIFSLHRQLNLTPKDLFVSIENLKTSGLIEVNEDRVSTTKDGIGYAVNTQLKTAQNDNQKFKKENTVGRKIEINEFYIPQNYEK